MLKSLFITSPRPNEARYLPATKVLSRPSR